MPNFGWVHKERILEDLHHRFIDEPQNKLNSCKLIFLTNNLDSCIMLMLQAGCWGERSLDWQKIGGVGTSCVGKWRVAADRSNYSSGTVWHINLRQVNSDFYQNYFWNGLLHFNCRGVELKERRAYIFLYNFASSGHFHKVAKMTTICTKNSPAARTLHRMMNPCEPWKFGSWWAPGISNWMLRGDNNKMWHRPLWSQEITWNIGKWGVLRINVLNLGAFYRQTRTVSFRVSNNRGVCQDGSSCCGTKAGKQGDISDPWQRCEAFRWLHFRPLFVFFKGWFC